jgi:LacI family transcriptional regulator
LSTIYDIAKATGFSVSTVARALSNKGYCNEEKKKIIAEVAKELNYAPVYSAKTLKSNKTNRILFVIPDICNPFYFDMINGANDVLSQHDYLMILYYTRHSLKEELKAIQNLRERYADGMIMVSFNFCKENIDAINSVNYPVVLTNKYESEDSECGYDYVYVDTRLGIMNATEHLLKQGHERIAFVGGSLNEQTGYERYEGYRDAIINSGLEIDDKYIYESNYTESGGYLCGKQILENEIFPTAAVAVNDLMAVGMIRAFDEAGKKVPEDIAVVGMDNTDTATRISPKLTSVAMMQEEIGRNAAQILMDRINGDSTDRKKVRLLPRLIVRESSVQKG